MAGPTMVQTMLFALSMLCIFVVMMIVDRRKRVDFNNRFPPISDDEFLSRCGQGTNPEVALKVRRIVADQFGVDYERIYPTTSFVRDLGAD
jgi:hypothetical protein